LLSRLRKELTTAMADKRVKVLIAKLGLDGHEVGPIKISRWLTDAGMEVVYLGRYQTPEGVVNSAIQENVDVIGLSFSSGEHLHYSSLVADKMREKKLGDVLFLVGGAIARSDIPKLKAMGVDEVFLPLTKKDELISYITQKVGQKGKAPKKKH
jgi:methylmalonyl-CoA mutase C-terminal domain/subunit